MSSYKYLEKFNHQKIALLGLGLDNQALLALLKSQKIKAEITIKDAQQDPKGFNKNLYTFSLSRLAIILSRNSRSHKKRQN